MTTRIVVDDEVVTVTVARSDDGIVATVGDRELRAPIRRHADGWVLDLADGAVAATVVRNGPEVWVAIAGEIYRCRQASDARDDVGTAGAGSPRVLAPMPGKVLDVLVTEGQAVTAGDTLVVLEAMKMETVAAADAAGRVLKVHVAPGAMVEPGQTLVELEFD